MAISGPTDSPGRRERKKQQTRRLIAETARGLFAARGFDAVTVAEVARAADVAEKTVFNHFATKEDLFYDGLEAFEDELLSALRERAPGEPIVAAFRRLLLEPRGAFAPGSAAERREAVERIAAISRVIVDSPALLAREQQAFARATASLAALLAEERGADPGDVEAWVAANALVGVHRALIGLVRRQVLAGARQPRLARELHAETVRALDLLERGLAGYAERPVPTDPPGA